MNLHSVMASFKNWVSRVRAHRPSWPELAGWAVLAAILVKSFAAPMAYLMGRWWRDPDYTHGFLVIPFAVYLLWARRGILAGLKPQGSGWGLAVLAVAGAMRCAGAYYDMAAVNTVALLPCLAGLVLWLFGRRALWWAVPSIVFLGFMVPLPGIVAARFSHPLQRAGTMAATWLLQLIGIPAISQGTTILLSEAQLGVVEACSGLKMMFMFLAICFGAAFVVRRPLLDRILIVLSAAPIALLANIVRLLITGILYEFVGNNAAEAFFHDLAGWFMMPMAVLLLALELMLVSMLLIAPYPIRKPAMIPIDLDEPKHPRNAAGKRRNNGTRKR